jgi:GNAT superfamily N-acetyltransferase
VTRISGQVEVRRATADAAAIAGVLYESFIEFKALYTDGGFAATALGPEPVLERISEGPVWIALCAGMVVGTVAAVVKGHSVYIRGMAVLPVRRGSGAGTALIREVETWAARERIDHLFLSTTPFLRSAIRLYEALGFRRKDQEVHDLFGTPLFTMEKNIAKDSPVRIT